MLVCLFVVLRRRNGDVIAFLCAATLLITPLYRPYAVEARPYSLVAASIAVAMVGYQRAPRLPWIVLMGASFITAESLHYYAFFAFVPFAVAEAAVLAKTRHFRWGIWIAMAAGFIPLVVLASLAGFSRILWHSLLVPRNSGSHSERLCFVLQDVCPHCHRPCPGISDDCFAKCSRRFGRICSRNAGSRWHCWPFP